LFGLRSFSILTSIIDARNPTNFCKAHSISSSSRSLPLGHIHGFAIADRVRQLSDDVLRINQSALYPALHRLEQQAWIEPEWGESENNCRAKFYSLIKAGRARLRIEEKSWDRLSTAVHGVLKAV
jgi:transcriptional regulator